MPLEFTKTFTHEIKKSKFIAFAYQLETKDEVKSTLEDLKKAHPKARHICYAYKLSNTAGMSDDGEPQGTAGKPMFNLLNMKNVDNTLVVVVRYFGGKKLGAGGLIRAYVAASKEVV